MRRPRTGPRAQRPASGASSGLSWRGSTMSDADLARRALRCLDLTELSDSCSEHLIDGLCRKALTPLGPAAAVCVWPQFVVRARDALEGSPVRVATVINFPRGNKDIEKVVEDAEEAVGDGADEIDCVMPYQAFLRGETALVADLIAGVREVVDGGRTLKVILETGALGVSEKIEAAEPMLASIRAAGKPVGLKVSGGIRTLESAKICFDLADRIMGPDWATPK